MREVRYAVTDAHEECYRPKLELSRWNELGFSLVPQMDGLRPGDLNFYEEGNGLESDLTLWKRPDNPLLQFRLKTKGLKFYRQDPLTREEIARGCRRPENVIGSYAVYMETPKPNYVGGTPYRSGKVGHFFRPQMIDTEGKTAWGELKIANGVLSVLIPPDFLATAKYPVRRAAGLTFGYTTAGASNTSLYADNPNGIQATGAAGTADSLSMYGYGTGNHKGIIALVSDSSIITNGIGNAADISGLGWHTSTFGTPPTISAIDYYICIIVGAADGVLYYDAVAGTYVSSGAANSYTSPTSPLNLATHSGAQYSIYVTYTAGGPTPISVPLSDVFNVG